MISATVGIYDGVHAGHRKILGKLAGGLGRSEVFVFVKNPRKGDRLLTTFKERKRILNSMGFSVIRLDIDKFWDMEAEDFFRKILIGKYGVRRFVIGGDFAFGRGRAGTIKRLRAWARDENVKVEVAGIKKSGAEKISTSRIKRLLSGGHVKDAARLLGRPYSVSGVRIKGRGISRLLGFPTINLKAESFKIIPAGVFAVSVTCAAGTCAAVLNSGPSPVFGIKNSFEFYVIPGQGSSPAKILRCRKFSVSFLKFIRKQKKYATVPLLKEKISRDVAIAKKLFI